MSPWEVLGWAIVSGLVSHRLWRMAARDTIFDGLRERLFPHDLDPETQPVRDFFDEMVECPWCLGFWLNGVVGLCLLLTGTMGFLAAGLVWLAGSTVTGVLGRGD